MDDFEKKIGDALTGENHYDSLREKNFKKETMKMYDSKLKKVERITFINLYICIAVALIAFHGFSVSSSTKELLIYSVLFIIAIEIQVLIKLWYWIMNSKLIVLKEIKNLQMQISKLDTEGRLDEDNEFSEKMLSIKGPGKRFKGTVGLVVFAILCSFGSFYIMNYTHAKVTKSIQIQNIEIEKDGSGIFINRVVNRNKNINPKMDYSFISSVYNEDIIVTDGYGNELPYTIAKEKDHYRYKMDLNKPVFPGEYFVTNTSWKQGNLAKRSNDIWTYTYKHSYGNNCEYSQIITLPEGAELVEIQPEPTSRIEKSGRQILRFEKYLEGNDFFECTIKYKL